MRSTLYVKLMLCVTMLSLASCKTLFYETEIEVPTSGADFCMVAKPISAKKTDDKFTLEQVNEHNNVGIALCGWKP